MWIRAWLWLFIIVSPNGWGLSLTLNHEPEIIIDAPVPTAIAGSSRRTPLDALSLSYSVSDYPQSIMPGSPASWHKIRIVASSELIAPTQKYVVVDNAILRHLSFYLLSKGHVMAERHMGLVDEQNPQRNGRPLDYKGNVFSFMMQPGEQYTLLIYKQNDGPSILPIRIYDESEFTTHIELRNLFWGGIMAVLIVMALYNLTVYAMHPSRAYLWYLAFHAIAFLYFSGLNGFGFLLWPYELQTWLAQNIMALNFMLVFLIVNFANVFLEAKEHAPTHHKWIKPLSAVSLIGFIASFIFTEAQLIPVFSVLQFIGTVFGISIGVVAFRNGYRPAKYFLISWVFTLSGGAVGMGTAIGAIPANLLTLHGFLLGTLCELFLFSVALAHRIKEAENKFLTRSFVYPDTNIANFSYLKNELINHLGIICQQHKHLHILIADMQGFREIVSLYGPTALTKSYREQTDRMSEYLHHQDWCVAMPLPNKKLVYLAALPGEQVFMLVDINPHQEEPENVIIQNLFRQADRMNEQPNENKIQFTIGCCQLLSAEDFLESFRRAQVALLHALQNQMPWQSYAPELDQAISHRSYVVKEIRQAIKLAVFEPHIQPQFDLNTGQLRGGEILLRWHHPELGNVPPDTFITLAEQSGLIFAITKLVIEKVCRWIRDTKLQHPQSLNQLVFSINLSALDIAEPQLIPFIQSTLMFYEIDNKQICLEITESAISKNRDQFLKTIKQLHTLGFSISIDDFGTGYSSMQYLQTIAADEIKIDMRFVRGIEKDVTKQQITKAIVNLAHATQAHTVAEGIESEAELAWFKTSECQFGQGYLWAKPMSLEDFRQTHL